MPLKVMLGAQLMMLLAVIAGFALVAYIVHLNHPALAAVFGTIDLAGIVALFASVVRGGGREEE
jgi:hypothetical protein